MSKTSCIQWLPKSPMVIVREELVKVCGQIVLPEPEKNFDTNCAAAIINLFVFWTDVKINMARQVQTENEIRARNDEPPLEIDTWIWKTGEDLKTELLGIWGDTKITTALKYLVSSGILERRNNPKYHWDRTYQYRLVVDTLQRFIEQIQTLQGLNSRNQNPVFKGAIPQITSIEIKDIAPQSVAEETPDLSGNTKNDSSNTQLLAINNPDWDTLAAVIDANKPPSPVITKPIQPVGCPLPNTCDRGETCTPETCVMPRTDVTSAVIELRATDTTTSEFVRDMRAVSSKPARKGKRQQKEAPVILPENIQEIGRALVKSYWPMVARFGELSSPSRKQVIKVAWELKRMNIAPTDVTWFFDEWVTKRTWTEPYSLNVIVTWIQRALQQRALKKAQSPTSTVFVSPEDETKFEPMSLD